MQPIDELGLTVSSGNIFRDLGRSAFAMDMLKCKLAAEVSQAIWRRKWTQVEAADHLKIDQPRVSRLMRGQLSQFSAETLFDYLVRLELKVDIRLTVTDPLRSEPSEIAIAFVPASPSLRS